jgi:predicted peptidase
VKETFSILGISLALAVVIASSAIGQSPGSSAPGGASAMPRHVKSATAVGEVFGDGEKISAVIIEYDRDIDHSKLSPAAFSVTGRTITKVYSNKESARAPQGTNGRYVIIELSPDDRDAPLYSGGPGGPGGRPGGPGGPGGPGAPGAAGGPGGPPNAQANGGGGARGGMGMGMAAKKKPLKVTVDQVGEITTTTGEIYPADPTAFETDKGVNLVVDDFKQFEFKDPVTGITLGYNLFVPRNYDKNKSYPLVLFMHDASITGAETSRTLTQGLGAVVWATPSEQAKHEAFVLAPAFGNGLSTEGAVGDATADTVVHLVNSVTSQYNIDKNRMYTTGQSFGCMLSLAIMIRYPDLFAASMLVAGQRDAQATSVLLHNKMWIIVAEGDTRAFPGMNDSVAVWEKEGAKISKATWNARSSEAQLTADANKMLAEGNNIKYATFLKGTVFPAGQEGGIEHMATWPVAYRIEGVRDWLFAQTKSSRPQ